MMSSCYRSLVCLLMCSLTLIQHIQTKKYLSREMAEVCQNEALEAECAHDEVVLMERALYGRMRVSRCVDRNYGYIPCVDDVLRNADVICSGLQTCKIPIPTTAFDKWVSSCPKDFKSYLEASYQCVKIQTGDTGGCQNLVVSRSSGFIASSLTVGTGSHGSPQCPWRVHMQPGQRINITLYDFSGPGSEDLPECTHTFATIREISNTSIYRPARKVCGGGHRIQWIMLSGSNALEIRVFNSKEGRQFLLHYQAVGCTDLSSPVYGWAKRKGDETKIGCNGNEHMWRLHCHGNEWTGEKGPYNCTNTGAATFGEINLGKTKLPFGVSLAIILCIAIILGLSILCAGLVILKRRTERQPSSRPVLQETGKGTGLVGDTAFRSKSASPGTKDVESIYQSSENEYEYVDNLPPQYNCHQMTSRHMEMRKYDCCPPHKPIHGHAPVSGSARAHGTTHKSDPSADVRYVDAPDPPAYFELDPDMDRPGVSSGLSRPKAPTVIPALPPNQTGTSVSQTDMAGERGGALRGNQSIHEFSPYGYDHLIEDSSTNSNHKSV